MNHTKIKKGLVVLILILVLVRHLGFSAGELTGEKGLTSRFETTILDDFTQAFRTIRFNPADIYTHVFSNSGWNQ